jgi:hypothetical protein
LECHPQDDYWWLRTPSRSDFGPFVRGKYIERLRERSNVVVIAPDIADLFPNEASVNDALRALAEIAKRANSPRRRSS